MKMLGSNIDRFMEYDNYKYMYPVGHVGMDVECCKEYGISFLYKYISKGWGPWPGVDGMRKWLIGPCFALSLIEHQSNQRRLLQ
jgi:hypothetical protein